MYPIQKHNGTNAGDDALQENNDYDESEESNDMLQEHSMQIAAQDFAYHTDHNENC